MRGRLWSEFDGLLFCLAEFPSVTIPHDRGDRGSALHTEAITHTHARARAAMQQLMVQQHSPALGSQRVSVLLHGSFHRNGLGLSLSCCGSHSTHSSVKAFSNTPGRGRVCVCVSRYSLSHSMSVS